MPRSRASRRYDGGGRELSSKKRNDVGEKGSARQSGRLGGRRAENYPGGLKLSLCLRVEQAWFVGCVEWLSKLVSTEYSMEQAAWMDVSEQYGGRSDWSVVHRTAS